MNENSIYYISPPNKKERHVKKKKCIGHILGINVQTSNKNSLHIYLESTVKKIKNKKKHLKNVSATVISVTSFEKKNNDLVKHSDINNLIFHMLYRVDKYVTLSE